MYITDDLKVASEFDFVSGTSTGSLYITNDLNVVGSVALPANSILDAMIDWDNLTDLAAGGEVTWSNLASGELTSEVLLIGTDVKGGTLTDTKYCTWDDGNSQIVCNSEAGSGDTSHWDYLGDNYLAPSTTVGMIVSASSTIEGNLNITGNTTSTNATTTGGMYITKDGYVGGALTVIGVSSSTGGMNTQGSSHIGGDLSVDGRTTSTGQMFAEGSRVTSYDDKCFTMASTTWQTGFIDIPLWFPPKPITVTDVYCIVDGGTSIPITFGDGTNDFEAVTCDTDGQADDGSISNGTFTANERLQVDLGTVTGTVNYLNACIKYTVDAD
jgi:hypothetical protein